MKISHPAPKRYIVPKHCGNFYKCECGNRLVSRWLQKQCEICGAWIDWNSAIEAERRNEENDREKQS